MTLDKIQLSNYRNFIETELEFGSKCTIFIGKNGAGKTNLLSGMKQLLSFIFTMKKDELQYEFIASSDQRVKSFSATDARFGETTAGWDYIYPVSIKGTATSAAGVLSWEFLKENESGGLKDTLYREANASFWNYYINNMSELPLLAYFSYSYPHVKTKIGDKIQDKLNSGFPLPANTAYYKWDEDKDCLKIWEQYFIMQYKNWKFENGRGDENYINYITQKLIDFSKPISNDQANQELQIESLRVVVGGKRESLLVQFKDGRAIPFSELPQGYKRIFSMVFDLANRSYLLLKHCNPTGIVIIDEIELHLHPSLAQEILPRLTQTFDKMQFIVSTHSPLVITNCKQDDANRIYKLYRDGKEYEKIMVDNLYGVDYNSGLKHTMDTPPRNTELENLLEAYAYWNTLENKLMSDRIKNQIKILVGEDSSIYQSLN